MTRQLGLDGTSDEERDLSLERFRILRSFFEDGVPLSRIAEHENVSLRTARRWVQRYRAFGLPGLGRKARADKDRRRISTGLAEAIEGLALQRPRLTAAAIHKHAVAVAGQLGKAPPSYGCVYEIIRRLNPALLTMAHEGAKAYGDRYDLVHRAEASGPNAVWQADHTELDVVVLDDAGAARRPWLTIILDDYSRAVSGFFVTFSAPSALQTAHTLRQAIWRKGVPGWSVCGVPQMLYTDHGSDFTSRHIEQVAADLKIRLVFSGVGRPRGRGKIERFFSTVNQQFLSRLPGYSPAGFHAKPVLTLPQLGGEFEHYLIREYHVTAHATTGEAPQARWSEVPQGWWSRSYGCRLPRGGQPWPARRTPVSS